MFDPVSDHKAPWLVRHIYRERRMRQKPWGSVTTELED